MLNTAAQAQQWKAELLPRLEGFDLFPFGGGPKGKAPIGGNEWQKKPYTAQGIAELNGSCRCVAVYPSEDAGIEAFDVDGKTAYEHLVNDLGVDPDKAVDAGAWKIGRPSDPYRFKLIFRTGDQQLEAFKGSIVTLWGEKNGKKIPIEQIEYFYGKQGAIVAGLHKDSGDHYQWQNGPNGNGIKDLIETPIAWRKVRAIIRSNAAQTSKPAEAGKGWNDARSIFGGKCPACGRDAGEDCRATADGHALQCHHGATFCPSLSWPIGHRIEANGNVLVLRNHDSTNAIGKCSLFTLETPEDVYQAEDSALRREQLQAFRATFNSTLALSQVFNSELANLLEKRAESLPCDPVAYITPLLATAAGVVGKRMSFVVKGGEDCWAEPCVIWCGNVMAPSSLKSPIAADIRKPVDRMQRESIERCKPSKDDDDADKETPRRFAFGGITHAAMVDLICEEKTQGLIGYYDELASLFAELEKTHNTAMRAELLLLWTGGPISRDTKTSGHAYASATAVSFYGNIQPDKLKSLINKDGAENSAGDGLWCRFLWVRPKEIVWQYNDLVANIQQKLSDVFDALDKTPHNSILQLSPEAIAIGAQQWNLWEYEKQDCDAAQAAFIGKLRGYSVRIAGVLHLLDLATDQGDPFNSAMLQLGDGLIPAAAMQRAILLCQFCLGQWQQLQAELGHGDVPATVTKLLSKAQGLAAVTPRDVCRWHLLGRNTKTAEAVAFLHDVAQQWGCGSIRAGKRGGIHWCPD